METTLDIGSTADQGDSVEGVATEQRPRRGLQAGGYYWGTGRRKTAVARVRIKHGEGKIRINKPEKDLEDFFRLEKDRQAVLAPLKAVDGLKKIDVWVNVRGGGHTGQAGAVVMGLARALEAMDPKFSQVLRDGHFLTRDGRMTERKKYGQRGARRRFQFSKR